MNDQGYTVIPDEILLDDQLTSTEKLVLAYILRLSNNEKGYCWATNGCFAKKLNIKKRQIGYIIKKLTNMKRINCTFITKSIRKMTIAVDCYSIAVDCYRDSSRLLGGDSSRLLTTNTSITNRYTNTQSTNVDTNTFSKTELQSVKGTHPLTSVLPQEGEVQDDKEKKYPDLADNKQKKRFQKSDYALVSDTVKYWNNKNYVPQCTGLSDKEKYMIIPFLKRINNIHGVIDEYNKQLAKETQSKYKNTFADFFIKKRYEKYIMKEQPVVYSAW